MSRAFLRLVAAAVAALLVVAACGDDASDDPVATTATTQAPPAASEDEAASDDPVATTESTQAPPAEDLVDAPGTVVEVAVESGAFPTLVAAVQAAGLVDALSGEGPFTVFAPTEEAFAAALDGLGMTAQELLAETELLTAVLTYHVLPLAAPAEVVSTLDGQAVATVNGAEVVITIDSGTVRVNDATVVATDIAAANGIIHVIDTVLIPPATG